jgi:hypothetical protein
MSDFFGLDPSGWDLTDPGAISYARGAVIAAGARQGASANAIMGQLAGTPLGIQRSVGLGIIREFKDQIAAGQTATALGFDASSGELLLGAPPANWTGQYNHEVTATFRTKDEEGNWMLNFVTRNITSNEPLSPQEAANAAMDILATPADPDADSEPPDINAVISVQLTGAWYRTARGPLYGL